MSWHEPEQLELFEIPAIVISLPPCGRGLGPCRGVIENDTIRCLTCGGIAPLRHRMAGPISVTDARVTERSAVDKIFFGFIESQMKFRQRR